MTPTATAHNAERITAALLHPATLATLAGTDPRELAAVAAILASEADSISTQILHPARAQVLRALADALDVASR